jgi:fructokinase
MPVGQPGPFVVAGESLVDVVLTPDGQERAAGGSPMNVAVGLSRLGRPVELRTVLGDDDDGRFLARHIHEAGVALGTPLRDDVVTSTATARLDAGGTATYDFDLHWDLEVSALPADCRGLHVGSLGTLLDPGRAAVLDLVRQAADRDLLGGYDPNVRPALLPDVTGAWQDVREIAAAATVVKVSDEDLAVLRPGQDPALLARRLLTGARTRLVLVTAGAEGASAYTANLEVHRAAPVIRVVDTVGAGDSFMAAALAVLASPRGPALDDVAQAESLVGALLEVCTAAAAVTCSRRGANPPTRRELGTAWPVDS